MRQWVYFEKLGFRFPLAIIREWGIDSSIISDPKELREIYTLLINELQAASLNRKCVATLFGITDQFPLFSGILRKNQFILTSGGVLMINELIPVKELHHQKKKPINMDVGEMFLFP